MATHITSHITAELHQYLSTHPCDQVFVLTDTHTREACLPLLAPALTPFSPIHITLPPGDTHKNLEQLTTVWNTLSSCNATRSSLLINTGGGMITDLGGFAAATFKRGIRHLNIPTTLMAAVDAATGGKTGINYHGLKNEIGAFHTPDCVLIDCIFLATLDNNNLLSGYAEMIKHGLIDHEKALHQTLSFDLARLLTSPPAHRIPQDLLHPLNDLVRTSVTLKEQIVAQDPHETGLRKALNLGHTIGHALESLTLAQNRPVLHGHAVAAGLICELYLSHKHTALPLDTLRHVTHFIKAHYPPLFFTCDDYPTLYQYMTHDKKNHANHILFTLLEHVGQIRINQETTPDNIFEALDFYRENIY
jgi:3-dehydroquinate synthase